MPAETESLGGRLPLADPAQLTNAQRELYNRIMRTQVPWADGAHFQSRTEDGRLIGPFNPVLFSPGIGAHFLDLQATEEAQTTLSQRVRQVVILTVGSVWQAPYELYAHSAVGRQAGLPQAAIRALAAGELPDELSEQEKIAQRSTRQLSAEHRVEQALYQTAEQSFGQQGTVDMVFLVGNYHTVCGLLTAFDIPAPREDDR